MDLTNTAIPPPLDDDDEDVHWALSTASALWSRGERAEALKWLRRAAETASDANADERALTLFKAAADVTARLETPHAPAPQVYPQPPPPAHAYTPQPPQAFAQHPAYAQPPQGHPQAPAATPQAPPVTAAPHSVPQRAPRPASVPAPAPAAAPRPASVPAPAAPRPMPPARPSTPGGFGAQSAPPAQPFELQRLGPGVPSMRPSTEPAQTTSSPPAARVSRPIHAPPVPIGAHEPSSIRQAPPAPIAEAPVTPQTPRVPQNEPANEPQNGTSTARAHGPRVRRPPPSEVDTLKQPRPQIQSQVPTSRPPADVRPAPPVHVPPAPISGSSALERPFVDRTPSQVRSRPESHDEDVTAQRNLADFPGMGFDDLDEETNVLGSAAEHAQLFASELRGGVAEDEDRTGELDDKGDATVSTRPGRPPVDLGSTQPDSFEPPKERPGTRRTVDIPAPGSAERRGPVLLQGVRVAVLAGVRAGELRVVALEPDAMAPPGGVPAVLLALSPENGSAILRMLNEE